MYLFAVLILIADSLAWVSAQGSGKICIKTSFGHVCKDGELKIGGITIFLDKNKGTAGRGGMSGGNGRRGGRQRGMGRGGMGMRGYGMGMGKAVAKKKRRNNDAISKAAVKKIKNSCRKGKCRKQPKKAKKAKKEVKAAAVKRFKELYNGDTAKAEKEAEEQVKSVFAAKKAIAESQGLGGVVDPLDDGLWEGDMILTKEQSAAIAYDALNGQKLPSPGRRRKARNAQFLENYPFYKWDLPINYWIMPGFTTIERLMILNAVNNIQSQTCLRFRQRYSGHHMRFYKTPSAGFCGRSPVGNLRSFNTIEINTDCNHITGVTVHEILHSLGIHHTQKRYDRDNYIQVLWQNVDPQVSVDYFSTLSPSMYSTYGTPYDYSSVMHYSPYAGAHRGGLQTMEPTRNPRDQYRKLMGSRGGLSKTDAELVKKLYCKSGCPDTSPYCGAWANVGYCTGGSYIRFMNTYCKKSCNLC